MQEDIEANFSSGSFTFEGRKTVDVASLLKQFIRELPVPLLTYELLPSFASIADINDLKEQVRTLNLLILILPSLHQSVLKVSKGCVVWLHVHVSTVLASILRKDIQGNRVQ